MATASQRGRVLADRYELQDRLGRGGAGTVWRGHDRALDRAVAVKLLHADLAGDPAAGARFRTEATAAAKLTHPNAVLVYDLGRDGDDDYLVMELVEGVDLADVLRDGPLPPALAATVGAQVAAALGGAHRSGIVHRDVKPGNVLITTEGVPKLADFGIARALGEATARLTRTGMVLGTARYLAPEQLRDDPIDARADVYALGLVLHEILTGRAPFGEGSAVEVAARRLTTELPSVRALVDGVPPGLEEVIDWATRLDPRERPADGEELASALRRFTTPDATAAIAGRVAQVPRRTTTPAPSDRIEPIAPEAAAVDGQARLDAVAPVDPEAAAAPADEPAAPAPDDPAAVGATRAIPTATGERDRVPSVGTRSASAGGTGEAGQRDATSTLAPDRAAGTDAPGDDDGGTSVGRRVVLGVVAAVAVLLVVIGLNQAGDDGTDDAASSDGGAPTADTGDPDAEAGEPLTIDDAGDLDPDGDQRERSGDVPLAFDGDPETYWPTETYNSADFGGFDKGGVGIWFELDEPQPLDRVEVELSAAGGAVELWVSDGGPPAADQSPDGWGTRLGGGEVPSPRMQFPNLPDGEVRTVLLWFTELPEGGRAFRAEVREVRILGR